MVHATSMSTTPTQPPPEAVGRRPLSYREWIAYKLERLEALYVMVRGVRDAILEAMHRRGLPSTPAASAARAITAPPLWKKMLPCY